LIGVFLSSTNPVATAPPAIEFTNTSFLTLSPGLNQTFFIGDGLTGTGTGSVQQFFVPQDATQLYLGFADGNNFTGPPTTYNDDIGSLNVSYTLASVPEPSSVLLIGIGIAGMAGYEWRRRKLRAA
jgi:hypothetical protein